MSKIKFYRGDATKPMQKGNIVIPHICNNLGRWGAGFTGAITKRWPNVEMNYRTWFKNKIDHEDIPFRLGRVSIVSAGQGIFVANMLAQDGTINEPGQWLPPIRYGALALAMYYVLQQTKSKKASIHCPKFGCGLAGGNWEVIRSMIREIWVARGIDVSIYSI